MAVWQRKPKTKVHVHSDQGSQFTGYEWQEFLEQHNLVPSMSRRGNCWDNAVVESFFNLLKRERIRRRKYKPAKKPAATCSITSSSSKTRSENTLGMACCHRSPSNSSRN
jgi:transposase InsO family protein